MQELTELSPCMMRTKAFNPCNGDISEYKFCQNPKDLTIFNAEYIGQTILKEVRSQFISHRPASGGYKNVVRPARVH